MADRILIVEDERITAADLHDTLLELGYVVTGVVATGAEAILEAEGNRPDIVLMDIRIKGDMDGTETAHILRDRFNIPAVYLTAHVDRETLDRAKRSRPLGYIVKPFQRAELQANIEIAIDGHRQTLRAQQRYQQLTDVLSAVLLGIISIDHKEIVILFNPAAENLTGWDRDDALGNQVRRVFRLLDMSSGMPIELPLERALDDNVLSEFNDTLLVNKRGGTTPVAGNIAPVNDVMGGGAGGIGRALGAVIVFEATPPRPEDPYFKMTRKKQGEEGSLTFGSFHIVAASPAMKQLLAYSLRVARSEIPAILVEGETGTGKDLLAQFIHHSSSRRTGPFVAVNCSAIPDALLESELFGHEPGAYTDARTLKKGLFEAAQGGTLFLDEIGDMAPHMQSKLLRAVEERWFRRLGGVQDIEADVRIVAATNRDLSAAIEGGRFRLDLYHRLSVIQLTIPPLRARREEIVPLAEHFLRLYGRKYNLNPPPLSQDAASRLIAHDWPGNVRELRNVIERAMVLEDSGTVHASSIRFTMERVPGETSKAAVEPGAVPDGPPTIAHAERELILRALQHCGNNQTQAAQELGVTRDILRHRMKKYGLFRPKNRA